jgi:hypothetical protein
MACYGDSFTFLLFFYFTFIHAIAREKRLFIEVAIWYMDIQNIKVIGKVVYSISPVAS